MSEYSFMRSGSSNIPIQNPDIMSPADLMALLALFSSRSMENAAKYVDYCDRNGVTTTDVIYGLRYEVFEFMNNPNIINEANEMKEEMESVEDEEDDDDSDWEDIIVEDDEIEAFHRIDNTKIDEHNRQFITKMHKYYDEWDSWVPDSPLNIIFKNSIDKAGAI